MRLGYVILYVPDVTATVEFYQKSFGLELRFAMENTYAEMETGGTALAFCREDFPPTVGHFRPTTPGEKAPAAEIGLVSDDVAKSFARAVEAGATSVVEPVTKPWGQVVSYVRDNNGFLVEICSKLS